MEIEISSKAGEVFYCLLINFQHFIQCILDSDVMYDTDGIHRLVFVYIHISVYTYRYICIYTYRKGGFQGPNEHLSQPSE